MTYTRLGQLNAAVWKRAGYRKISLLAGAKLSGLPDKEMSSLSAISYPPIKWNYYAGLKKYRSKFEAQIGPGYLYYVQSILATRGLYIKRDRVNGAKKFLRHWLLRQNIKTFCKKHRAEEQTVRWTVKMITVNLRNRQGFGITQSRWLSYCRQHELSQDILDAIKEARFLLEDPVQDTEEEEGEEDHDNDHQQSRQMPKNAPGGQQPQGRGNSQNRSSSRRRKQRRRKKKGS